jgi:hypothetical protein
MGTALACHVRETFHGDLALLGEQLADMCAMAAESMRRASQALLTADLPLVLCPGTLAGVVTRRSGSLSGDRCGARVDGWQILSGCAG